MRGWNFFSLFYRVLYRDRRPDALLLVIMGDGYIIQSCFTRYAFTHRPKIITFKEKILLFVMHLQTGQKKCITFEKKNLVTRHAFTHRPKKALVLKMNTLYSERTHFVLKL